MFALVTWAYRQGHRPISAHLAQMGLWDLDEGLDRSPTSLVETYRQLVTGNSGVRWKSHRPLVRKQETV
jgi:beta-glucosidase